ncbi:MAG: hypothetical protein HQM08_28770 [Candidatus Riflebacteria bacterium]|nr:hypothetical protein [Candidatus Riflebacteria bacterium]
MKKKQIPRWGLLFGSRKKKLVAAYKEDKTVNEFDYFSKLWNLESTLKIWIDGKLNLSELVKLEEQIKTIKI